MKKLHLILILTLATALVGTDAMAQRNNNKQRKASKRISNYSGSAVRFSKGKQYNSVGFGIAAMNYFGDLAPLSKAASTDISFTRPGFALEATHKFGPFYSIRASLAWGRLKANDESADPFDEIALARYTRNLSFRNDIKELSVTAEIDLVSNNGGANSRKLLTPYVFAGVALFHHNPRALAPETDRNGNPVEEAGKWVALQPLGTEGQFSDQYDVKPYKRLQISIPVGLGLKYRINSSFDLSLEVGYRYLFTDYIDDVSGLYVDLGSLDSELAKTMSDRSQEIFFVESGLPRNQEQIISRYRQISYVSEVDGLVYTTYNGFGKYREPTEVDRGNIRGNSADNDIYFVTVIKLNYILGPGGFGFGRGKFR